MISRRHQREIGKPSTTHYLGEARTNLLPSDFARPNSSMVPLPNDILARPRAKAITKRRRFRTAMLADAAPRTANPTETAAD